MIINFQLFENNENFKKGDIVIRPDNYDLF